MCCHAGNMSRLLFLIFYFSRAFIGQVTAVRPLFTEPEAVDMPRGQLVFARRGCGAAPAARLESFRVLSCIRPPAAFNSGDAYCLSLALVLSRRRGRILGVAGISGGEGLLPIRRRLGHYRAGCSQNADLRAFPTPDAVAGRGRGELGSQPTTRARGLQDCPALSTRHNVVAFSEPVGVWILPPQRRCCRASGICRFVYVNTHEADWFD